MKMDQIAFYARNRLEEFNIKALLGLGDAEWIVDQVMGHVEVGIDLNTNSGIEGNSVGLLQFNYDRGIEIEILRYMEGPNWHDNNPALYGGGGFISHIGYHLEDDEEFPRLASPLVQKMETKAHTNPFLVEKGRRYLYQIYDTRAVLGCYSKFIKRIRGANESQ